MSALSTAGAELISKLLWELLWAGHLDPLSHDSEPLPQVQPGLHGPHIHTHPSPSWPKRKYPAPRVWLLAPWMAEITSPLQPTSLYQNHNVSFLLLHAWGDFFF